MSPLLIIINTGVKIEVNESDSVLIIREGTVQVICFEADCHRQSRERDIPFSLEILPNSVTIGRYPPIIMCYLIQVIIINIIGTAFR